MKKVFTLIASIVMSLATFAQQVPNGGFETWSSPGSPDNWGTLGNIQGIGPFSPPTNFDYRDSTTFVEGHVSLKLVTDTLPASFGGIVTSSVATLGELSLNATTMQLVFSGYPYTKKPDSLYFSLKYTAASVKDTAEVAFTLNHAGTSITGGYVGGHIPDTHNTWAPFSINLTPYYSGATLPDTMQLIFQSSFDTAYAGSTLWIDAVHFNASVNTGIEDVNGPVLGVNAFPNPAVDVLNIAIQADEVGSQIQLFDMEGREVYNAILNSTKFVINTKSFQAGVYAIRVNSIDKMTIYNGKVSVTK